MNTNPEHVPLSQALSAMVANADSESIRIGELVNGTKERGFYLFIILFSLPFVSPIPLPGLSNVWGIAVLLLSFRLALRLPPRLPLFLGDRKISQERLKTFLLKTAAIAHTVEKIVKPRFGNWMEWRVPHFINAMLLALMGLMLALPLPPVLPFSHSLPCWAIIIIALAVMEGDGILIWLGYLIALGTIIYMFFFTGLALVAIHKLFHLICSLLVFA